MSAKAFLDTNVIAYSFDTSAPSKRQRALELMAEKEWALSWQVVQEFSNLALHKFAVPMKPEDLEDYLALVLWRHCTVFPSPAIYQSAMTVHSQTQYRFYDSLVVAAALASGAIILFSEDLQHGRKFGSLTIRNPFV
jgi:predicted nucleic acid-binding protein